MSMYNVSTSPHVRDKSSTSSIMLDVIIAMLPTALFGVFHFGFYSLVVIIATMAAAALAEYLYEKGMKKPITVRDYSALVTGMILALNMPPNVPLWIPILGAFFAIIIVKQLFGGLGQNWMNPALAARCFLLISCTGFMTDFTYKAGADVISGATPLAVMKEAFKGGNSAVAALAEKYTFGDLFIGNIPGTIGEVSTICLLIGAAYLLWKKVITWQIPVVYIGTVAVFTMLFGQHSLSYVIAELLSGGLIFGAFFMATDYVSSPITPMGQIWYAVFIGVMTGLFRLFGSGAEGVSYAIILGNVVAPLIEGWTIPKAFGKEDAKKK